MIFDDEFVACVPCQGTGRVPIDVTLVRKTSRITSTVLIECNACDALGRFSTALIAFDAEYESLVANLKREPDHDDQV